MFCAKDIMTTDLITIREDSTIKDVIRVLVRNRISGIPVVSEDMDIVGLVTEKDVLRMLYDRNAKIKTVKDLMTSDVTCYDEGDDLIEIFKGLVENKFRRVPILSQGKLVGIISRTDIIRFLSESAARPAQTGPEN